MTAVLTASQSPIFVSEIFPFTVQEPKILSFRLTPEVNNEARELGNRLSFHLSRKFPDVAVIWHQGNFLTL